MRLGDLLGQRSLTISRSCRKFGIFGIPVGLANPLTARLFILSSFVNELDRNDVNAVRVDFGVLEQRARSPPNSCMQLCVCEELLNGFRHNCKLCKYTNENYFFLFGTAPDGRWWTTVAQPYPKKLCNVVARCLENPVTAAPVRARELR